MSWWLRTRSPRATRTAMHRAAGIRQCSMAITPISSMKVTGMLPTLIITMSTEPAGRRHQEHRDDDQAQ